MSDSNDLQPTPSQIADLNRLEARIKEKRPLKFRKSDTDDSLKPVDQPPGMWSIMAMQATGAADSDAAELLLWQGMKTQPYGENLTSVNGSLALLQGIKPQDELEGMLATQMVAVHNMAMNYAKRAMGKDLMMEQADRYVNRATKLMNVFNRQVEALQKYRTKGQQKITVQHVQVCNGGQAVIGDINNGNR